MNQSNYKRYFQFFLIILAAGAIYPVIYLRTNYQVTILEVYNLTQPQLNNFYSMLGLAYIIGYIPSGLIADRISAKKLLAISLLGVSLCGFLFAQVPSPATVNAIFFMWGIFSVFTFWSAHLKVVKMLAKTTGVEGLGRIMEGGMADLVILNADFRDDIRNTEDIYMVISNGRIVDRKTD